MLQLNIILNIIYKQSLTILLAILINTLYAHTDRQNITSLTITFLVTTILRIVVTNTLLGRPFVEYKGKRRHCEGEKKRKRIPRNLPSIGNKLSVIGYDQAENGNGNNV